MSRRLDRDRDRDRDFDSRRHRSRFDREPSPKRSRRDGKRETERASRNGDAGDRHDKDQNKRQRLQDALPLEAATDSTAPTGCLNKEPEKRSDEQREGTKRSSDRHEGTKCSSEHRDGTKRSSEHREGTKRTSEHREGTKRSSEHREGTKRSFEQREGANHSSEQNEGAKHSSEQHEGAKHSSEQREEAKHSSEQREGTKRSSEPTEAPRSRSFFQHDERGSSARSGRSYSRRAAPERGRLVSIKETETEFERGGKTSDTRKDDRSRFNGEDNGKWQHEKFPEVEHNLPPPPPFPRKRPAFREKKITVEAEGGEKDVKEPEKPSHPDRFASGSERRDDKERNQRHWDKHERVTGGDRVGSRDGAQRGVYTSRERNSGVGDYRGRDRFNGRQGGYPPSGTRIEKWKHDLFDGANKTPPPRNEDEQIAKLEALLAS